VVYVTRIQHKVENTRTHKCCMRHSGTDTIFMDRMKVFKQIVK